MIRSCSARPAAVAQVYGAGGRIVPGVLHPLPGVHMDAQRPACRQRGLDPGVEAPEGLGRAVDMVVRHHLVEVRVGGIIEELPVLLARLGAILVDDGDVRPLQEERVAEALERDNARRGILRGAPREDAAAGEAHRVAAPEDRARGGVDEVDPVSERPRRGEHHLVDPPRVPALHEHQLRAPLLRPQPRAAPEVRPRDPRRLPLADARLSEGAAPLQPPVEGAGHDGRRPRGIEVDVEERAYDGDAVEDLLIGWLRWRMNNNPEAAPTPVLKQFGNINFGIAAMHIECALNTQPHFWRFSSDNKGLLIAYKEET